MSTAQQRQKIGYLRKTLGLDDDLYYEMLKEAYNVESSIALTMNQADEFLKKLRKMAIQSGVIKPRSQNAFQKYNYSNLDERPDMATGKQLRMIEAMWADITRAQDKERRKAALNAFVKRICGVENIRFLKKCDVQKVIAALKNMKNKKEV